MKVNIHGVSHVLQRVLPPPGGHNGQIVEALGKSTRCGNYVRVRSAQNNGVGGLKKKEEKFKWLRPLWQFGPA